MIYCNFSDKKAAFNTREYSITDFLVYDVRDELYVTDTLGRLFAVKLSDCEISDSHCFFQTSIECIAFSPNQSYVAICYATGCCQISSSQSFVIELNLTDHQYDAKAVSRPIGRVVIREDIRRMKEVWRV